MSAKNPDVIYVASLVTVRSTDGGKTWVSLRGAPGGDDYQNLWINPDNPEIILLVADQGALVTVNGGRTWSSWYNQPTAQLYHIGITNTWPYKVCSGQQESGSVCISSRGNDGQINFRDWHPVGTIEYGYVAPDPLDADVVYGAGRSEVSRFHWSTGQVQIITPIPVRSGKYRADRTQPIMFSPADPHILYYTTNVLFKTTDRGQTWQTISPDLSRENAGMPASIGALAGKNPDAAKQRGVIYALASSFKDPNILWAGTDDGLVWNTRDGGKNWNNITPKDLIPWSKVTQISASRFDDNTAYVSVSRFRIDDTRPYLYRTHDGGKTWDTITSGLPPDAAADTVREDPVRKGMLYAGTENAVWVSFDDGDHWQSLQLNLPHTSMRDLWIHDNDLIVATHGRGFWILDDITPLRQMAEATAAGDAFLFTPETAMRARRDTNSDTPIPPDEPAAANPPHGAVIDYYLSRAAGDAVVLEILDSSGRTVRRYSSSDLPTITEDDLKKQLIPPYWVEPTKTLATTAGMHRWVWDLHYPAPVATHREYPIAAIAGDTPAVPQGPHAVPGSYTARLTVNGRKYDAPLTVKLDPRVATSQADLQAQFELESRLAMQLSSSSEAILQARSLRDQLRKLADGNANNKAATDALQKLTAILSGTSQAEGGQPGLTKVNGNVSSLYGAVGQADAAPTSAEIAAAADNEKDLTEAMKRWEQFKTTDLPALNRDLKAASLPELHIESAARLERNQSDME